MQTKNVCLYVQGCLNAPYNQLAWAWVSLGVAKENNNLLNGIGIGLAVGLDSCSMKD